MEVPGIAAPSAKTWRQFRGNTYYHQQTLQLDAYSKELQNVAQLLQEQVAEQQLRARTLQELVVQQEAIFATVRAAHGPAAVAATPQSSAGSYTHGLLLVSSTTAVAESQRHDSKGAVAVLSLLLSACMLYVRKRTMLLRCLSGGWFHCGLV
jgi:hypothetical protein